MVLLQELLHLVHEVIRVFLRLAKLVSQSFHLLVETGLDSIEVDMVALLILPHVNLQIPRVVLLHIDVVPDALKYMLLLLLDLCVQLLDLVPQDLHVGEALSRALKNNLGHENVRPAHKLLILLDLGVEKARENFFTCLDPTSRLADHALGEPGIVQLVCYGFCAAALLKRLSVHGLAGSRSLRRPAVRRF